MKLIESLSDKISNVIKLIQSNPDLSLKYVILFIVSVTLLVLLGRLAELLTQLSHDRRLERGSVLLEILPKETVKMKDTEVLIRNIHSLLLNTKLRKILYGRPYMSYEIVAEEEKIKFYIKVPKGFKNIIQERIYATYTDIAIKEVAADYLPDKVWVSGKDVLEFLYKLASYPFKKNSFKVPKNHLKVRGTEMELGYHHIFKIKTKTDKDILASIMSGMKSLEWHEKVVVQILARPLDNDWQIKGRKILEQFELNGIRPVRGSDFKNFFKSLSNQLGEELDRELDEIGIKRIGGSTTRKTRGERKEIIGGSDKLFEPGFETVIRVMAIGHYEKGSNSRVKGITAAWNELDQENRFKRDVILAKKLFYKRTKNRRMYLVDRQNILTPTELSNFFLRFPSAELIDDFPEIEFLKVKEFAPPKNVETQKNILGKNFYRGEETLIGIKENDLRRHIVVQGRTGTGKSEWLKTFLREHIKKGYGCLLLEPHGKLADEFLELIPEERWKDVIYFDLFDPYPPGFNFCKVFDRKGVSYEDQLEKTTEEVIEIFARAFSDAWSSKNEYYITNALKTVIELQQGGILDIQRLFVDKKFREYAVSKIKDGQVKSFWMSEFAENKNGSLSQGTQQTVLSVMHKLGKFLNSRKLLRSIGQDGCIDFKEVLDNNKIVIFRFSKENMSEDRISFLGGIAIKLSIVAAFARDKSKWGDPFILALDEAQNFITPSIETALDELRKFGVTLLPMHQRLDQMEKVPGLLNAIYGNVGTTITFAVGQPDAPFFEKIYGPRVDERDLQNLPSRYGYCKLLVDGETSNTFNIYSVDSPKVDKKTAKRAAAQIKIMNREGRLHYKEIDKLLEDRIENYNNVDEVGDDLEKQHFVEELDDDYNIIEKIEAYKEAAPAIQEPEEDLEENEAIDNQDFELESDYMDIENEEIDIYVENSYEEEMDQENILEEVIEDQSQKTEKITIADFLEDEINSDKAEEEIEIDEAEAYFDEKLDDLEQYKYMNSNELWNESKEIEENAIKMANEKPEDPQQESAKNLWEIAKLKEKEQKGR